MLNKPKEWPAEWQTGLIKTQNAMGIMTVELSPAAEEFIKFAAQARQPVLDIGAAYGNAALPALQAGATVIACDLEQKHLDVLKQAVPVELQDELVLKKACFPDELNFAKGSLSAILISQVLHFFDGDTIERSLQRCQEWLEPDGKLFIVVATPYLSYYYDTFLPEYQRRAQTKEKWPGTLNPRLIAPAEWQGQLPDFLNLLDKDVLERVTLAAGFTVERMDYFCFSYYPVQHRRNDQEFISMVARKQ